MVWESFYISQDEMKNRDQSGCTAEHCLESFKIGDEDECDGPTEWEEGQWVLGLPNPHHVDMYTMNLGVFCFGLGTSGGGSKGMVTEKKEIQLYLGTQDKGKGENFTIRMGTFELELCKKK